VAVVYWPRHSRQETGRILAGLDAAAVTSLEISDNSGKTVKLEKKDGAWQVRLADASLYPAAAGKVEKILEKLASLDTARLVSSSASARRRLEVAEEHFNRRVKLAAAGDTFELYLGTSPGYKRIHVRRGGGDGIYLVRDLAAWELAATVSSWWKHEYLDYDPGRVTALAVKNGHGEFRLERKSGKWQAEGRELDQNRAASLVSDLCRLTITDVVTEKGFAPRGEPEATLTIEGKDGKRVLSVWKPEKKDGDYTVKLEDASHYARAAKYALGRLLDATLAGFLPAEKAAAAKAGADK